MGQYDDFDDLMKGADTFDSVVPEIEKPKLRMKEDPAPTMDEGAQPNTGFVDMQAIRRNNEANASMNGGMAGGMNGGMNAGGYGGGYGQPSMNSAFNSAPKQSSSAAKYIVLAIVAVIAIALVSVVIKFIKTRYVPGVVTGNSYVNEYFDIKADLSSDWEVAGYEGGADAVKKDLNSGKIVTEIQATKQASSNSVSTFNIMVKNGLIGMDNLDLSKVMGQYADEVKRELEGMGFSNVQMEQTKTMVAGRNLDAYKIKATYTYGKQSITMVVIQAYMVKGRYVAAFTAGGLSENDAKTALDQIKLYSGN